MVAKDHPDHDFLGELYRRRADVALAQNDAAQAESDARRALAQK